MKNVSKMSHEELIDLCRKKKIGFVGKSADELRAAYLKVVKHRLKKRSQLRSNPLALRAWILP